MTRCLQLVASVLMLVFSAGSLHGQNCDPGFDGITPVGGGATQLFNGEVCANKSINPGGMRILYTNVDDGGDPNNVEFFIDWNDGTTQTLRFADGDITLIDPLFRSYQADVTHLFPPNGADVRCEYIPTTFLQFNGTVCPASASSPPPYVRWNTEDQLTGEHLVAEQVTGANEFEVCRGETVTVRFSDQSTFNCVPPQYNNLINARDRWTRFTYGTINTITSATGVQVDGAVQAYPYVGPVLNQPQPVIGPSAVSFDITIPDDAQLGEIFQITMESWNFCNRFDLGEPPVVTTGLIRVIDSPGAPTVLPSPAEFCEGDPVSATATGTGSGTFTWYADAALTTPVHGGATFDPINNPPPVNAIDTTVAFANTLTTPFWVTETLGSTNCEGPATQVDFIIYKQPTTAVAGPDQNVCAATATLAANTPVRGTGQWVIVSGPGAVTTPTDPNSGVTGLVAGQSTVFEWQITFGVCTSTSQVTITRDEPASASDPGPDVSLCTGTVVTMTATAPAVGTGTWSVVSGPGVVTPGDENDPNATITGLTAGVNTVMRWTVSNGTCPPNFADVTITNDLDPPADAGPDFASCAATGTLGATPVPVGLGTWSVVSGPGNVLAGEENNPTAPIENLVIGTPTVFRWSVTNGSCNDFDDVEVTRDIGAPSGTSAGADRNICGDFDVLSGTVPTSGAGLWTIISGSGNISNPTAPMTNVTNIGGGANVFRWTITNGCGSDFAEVTINNLSTNLSNAGLDQDICGISTTLDGNDPGTATGTWTILSGVGGSITSPNDRNSVFTGVLGETYQLNWNIDNGTCFSNSQVNISFNETPVANAGGPYGDECDLDVTLAATPSVGTGTWTFAGPGTVSFAPNANDPNAVATATAYGTYTLTWTEDNNGCIDSDPVTVNFVEQTFANAGAGGNECDLDFDFNASFSVVGATGAWSQFSGPGTSGFSDPTSPTATVTVTVPGTYVFEWEESNGLCNSTDQVTVNFFEQPIADAGAPQTICGTSTNLAAVPSAGTGLWTVVAPLDGTGTFDDATSASALFTGDLVGAASKTYTLQWEETNGTCSDLSTVTITFDADPTVANAGVDQQVCGGAVAPASTILGGNPALIGIGNWTMVSNPDGQGVPVNPAANNSQFLGTPGVTYELEWTISNGVCAPSSDRVIIQFDEAPTVADAGPDRTICGISHTLEANAPTVGTGAWTLISNPDGLGSVVNPANPNSTFNGTAGITYVLQWTITNGICPASFDQVSVTFGPPLPAPIIAGTPNGCIGDILTFTVPGGDPALYNYSWDLSSLPPSTNVLAGSGDPFQFITLEFNDPFTADLRVTIEDKVSGCIGTTESFTVTINQVPDMVLSSSDADLIICTGESVTFTATDNNGVATEFDFILNGTIVQSGPSNTYTTNTIPNVNSMVVVGRTGVCPSNPSAPLVHTLVPLPTVFNTNGGGNFCDSGAGLLVGLSGSEAGVDYELYLNGNPTGNVLRPGGGSFDYGLQTLAGDYTVVATDLNACSIQMNGVATITVNPLPNTYTITGGGTTCEGGAGLDVSLDDSDLSINYQLQLDGTAIGPLVAGTGGAISFGPQNLNGNYTVLAINSTTLCEVAMIGNVQVIAEPLPQVTETNNSPIICGNESTNIVLDSTVPGSTFTWTATVSDPAFVSGATDQVTPVPAGSSIAQVISNTSDIVQQVIYTVTAVGPGPLNCVGPSKVIEVDINPLPTITVGSDATICNGSQAAITFDMTGTLPFTIVYNDGTQDLTIPNVAQSHFQPISPTATTTYSIVSVTDGNGCVNSSASTATITVLDAISDFSTSQPLSDCTPYEITFDNNNIIPGVTYVWSWGDGSPNDTTTNETQISHTYENNSTTLSLRYNTTLTAINSGISPACTDVSSVEVEILPSIFPDVRPDVTDGCGPLEVSFDNNTLGAADYRWFYRPRGTTQQNDVRTTPLVTYTLENTTTDSIVYEVVYEASRGSCSETVITEIIVYPEVTADFTVNGSDTPAPVSIDDVPHATIVNTTLNANSWNTQWDYGDGTTSTDPNPNSPYTYQNFGPYTIQLFVEDNAGRCSDSKAVPLLVEPTTPTVDFTGTPLSGCAPLTVDFTNESSSVDPDSYVWEFYAETGQLISTSSEENPSFVFNNPGVYTVQLSALSPLGNQVIESKADYIVVFEVPSASFLTRPTRLFLPDGILFTQNLSFGADTYLWDFGDGTTSDLFEPQHTYATVGAYDISLTVTSADGCVDSLVREQAVEVIEGGVVRIPNAFTPSLDGPSGGQPGNGTFNDVFLPVVEGVDDYLCQIFDRWGNLVFQSEDKNIGWDGYNRNGKLLPTGVYVYKLSLRFVTGEKSERIGDVTLIR